MLQTLPTQQVPVLGSPFNLCTKEVAWIVPGEL